MSTPELKEKIPGLSEGCNAFLCTARAIIVQFIQPIFKKKKIYIFVIVVMLFLLRFAIPGVGGSSAN